jgi:hypothetical protein
MIIIVTLSRISPDFSLMKLSWRVISDWIPDMDSSNLEKIASRKGNTFLARAHRITLHFRRSKPRIS